MKRYGILAALTAGCWVSSLAWGAPPRDFNDDGKIDLADFAVLQRQFTGPSCVPSVLISDLDGSGCVDLSDYAAMADVFAGGIPACDQVFSCGIPDPAGGANASVATCGGRQFRMKCGNPVCVGGSNPGAACPIGNECTGGGTCNLSAVDRRLCRLGVVMDGDASEGLSQGQSCQTLPPTPAPLASSFFRPKDRGVGFVDNFKDSADPSISPGPFGTDDQALCPDTDGPAGGPSGFNIGCSVMWFAPDDDPADGQDNSFLYIAWDLGDVHPASIAPILNPVASVPFDVDANGSACSQVSDEDAFPFKEFAQPEEYQVSLRSCAALSQYDSRFKVPLNNLDELSALLRLAPSEGLRTQFKVDDVLGVGLPDVTPEVLYFPTADPTINPTDGCVERELEVCRGHCTTAGNKGKCSGRQCVGGGNAGKACAAAGDCPGGACTADVACSTDANCAAGQRCLGDLCTVGSTCPAGSTCDLVLDPHGQAHSSEVIKRCSVSGAVCTTSADCPAGQTCNGRNANNVELVFKRIETSGFMGPHTGRVCSVSGKACRTASECPTGQTCNASAIAADGVKALENRLAMARLVANLFADADADGGECGSEELASVAAQIPLPGLEVKKEVRCAEQGGRSFTKQVDALVDSFVEFQITVENVGNEDLNVRLSDVLNEAQMGSLADCAVACRTCTGTGEPCEDNSDCPVGQTCTDAHAFLQATLTSPQRGLVDSAVTEANAASLGLEPVFFHTDPVGPTPFPACITVGSFLKSVKDNESAPGSPTSALLGTLRGRTAEPQLFCSRTGAPCTTSADCPSTNGTQFCVPGCGLTGGDKLVLRFAAKVGEQSGAFCTPENRRSPDCENAVTATGVQTSGALSCTTDMDCATLVPAQVCVLGSCGVRDQAKSIDTTAEKQANPAADDNVVTVNILCRDITFSKLVGFPGNDLSFVGDVDALGVPSVPPGEFVDIEYVYILDNVGETTESVSITDPQVCADVNATATAVPGGVSFVACALCKPPPGTQVGQIGPVNLTPAAPPLTSSCRIRFSKQEALRYFMRRDQRCVGGNSAGQNCVSDDDCINGSCEEDPVCTDEPSLPVDKRDDCYRNCASATADATALGDICRPPTQRLTEKSFTTICNTQCTVEVTKEVRCLPDCDPARLAPNQGWVADPAKLQVVPGACIQYRIVATNVNTEEVGICAISFEDTISNDSVFASGPTDVELLGKACTNVNFASEFNWDGNEVICKFDQLLQKGQSVTVLFRAIVADAFGDQDMPVNSIVVNAAGETDCPVGTAPPVFSCSDEADVAIDVDHCDLELRKEVTCDDPTNPDAVYEEDGIADALPGAKVGFRISIENTGDVPITTLELADTMTCSWTVSGITAHIGPLDVSACVCSGGLCANLASISGVKDLTPCLAGGIAAGQSLVITFEATVDPNFNTPDTTEDCKNTIIVRKGGTSVCSDADMGACPEKMAMVRVNVEVPAVSCDKLVCVDQDNDSVCDEEFDFAELVDVPGVLAVFPTTVIWKFQASNPGEVPLLNVQVCDAALVADLLNPIVGMAVGPCPILATGCADLGPIAPGATAIMGTCQARFETSEAWLEFADADNDGRAFCYSNATTVIGEVDSAELCDRGAETEVDGEACRARVCIEPPFVPTVSTWGMVILALSLLTLAKVHQRSPNRRLA